MEKSGFKMVYIFAPRNMPLMKLVHRHDKVCRASCIIIIQSDIFIFIFWYVQDDRELIARLKPFARFHSAKEHEELIENLLLAKKMRLVNQVIDLCLLA